MCLLFFSLNFLVFPFRFFLNVLEENQPQKGNLCVFSCFLWMFFFLFVFLNFFFGFFAVFSGETNHKKGICVLYIVFLCFFFPSAGARDRLITVENVPASARPCRWQSHMTNHLELWALTMDGTSGMAYMHELVWTYATARVSLRGCFFSHPIQSINGFSATTTHPTNTKMKTRSFFYSTCCGQGT